MDEQPKLRKPSGRGKKMLQRLLRRQSILTASIVLLMLLFAQASFAQSDAGAGGLRGEISNADGTAAANAATTVRNAETGYVRELHTNSRGQFEAQALPVGRYFVQASQGQFKTDEIEAIVTVGRSHTMTLVLKSVNQDAGGK